MQYFILNKPPGCITARHDEQDRPTVYAHVPPHFPALGHVGRLDFNTEGLLLFTDDGRLGQALLNKHFGQAAIEKVYHVKIKGRVGADDPRLERLREPLVYAGGVTTEPARVRVVADRSSATWIEVVITEGRFRQVRRLCERAELQIRKLRRVRIGPLELGELPLRWCRVLREEEVEALYAAALPGEARPAYEAIDDSPQAYRRARGEEP